MPGGRGWFGWPGNPYLFCRWFPWLPRWWWAYPAYGLPYYEATYAAIPKEQEIAMLEDQKKRMEEALKQINKRLKELRKGGPTG